MKSRLLKGVLLSTTLLFVAVVSAIAQNVVYDNTADANNRNTFYSSANIFGDQVTLVGTDRILSQFSIYYYFNGTAPSGTGVIRLYDNTGAGGAPGNLLYDGSSDPFTLQPNPGGGFRSTETINFPVSANVVLPDTFTWTIQFSNLGANQAGLLVYSPPAVGTSFNDFWEDVGGTWTPMQLGGGFNDFAAYVTAVPEPSTLALGALGFLAWAGIARYRKLRG